MRYVSMTSHNIGMNLATEQYLMNDKDFGREPLVLFTMKTHASLLDETRILLKKSTKITLRSIIFG